MKNGDCILVCEPLLRGAARCFFHLEQATTEPVIAYLDFETSGLNIARDHIVEIGLLAHRTSAVFSTAVCPPSLPAPGPSVHGIVDDELKQGPAFTTAYRRMVSFLDHLLISLVGEEAFDPSDDEPALDVRLRDPPQLIFCAHSGFQKQTKQLHLHQLQFNKLCVLFTD